jgi:hypothetical protein
MPSIRNARRGGPGFRPPLPSSSSLESRRDPRPTDQKAGQRPANNTPQGHLRIECSDNTEHSLELRYWNLELIHLALLPVGPTTFRTAAIPTSERSISKHCALRVATTRLPLVERRADSSCISTNCASLRRRKSGGAKPGASSPFGSRKEPRVAHR